MRTAFVIFIGLLVFACSPKKQETTTSTPVDSVGAGVDTVLATTPAQPVLAFDAVDGWIINNGVGLPDSVNYFLLGTQEEFKQKLGRDKKLGEAINPDFLINWVIAVVTKPSNRSAHFTLEKVETGESSIDVYLTITHGAPAKDTSSATAVYAIERRDGFPVMQFFVNGKKDKALVLVL